MSNNSQDRVEKWGKLLSELSEIKKQDIKDKNNKEKLINNRINQSFLECYNTLEKKASNFEPEQIKKQLSCLSQGIYSHSIVVFDHTVAPCLLSEKDYKHSILQAFQTNVFSLRVLNIIDIIDKFLDFIQEVKIAFTTFITCSVGILILLDLIKELSPSGIVEWLFLFCLSLGFTGIFALIMLGFYEYIVEPCISSFRFRLQKKSINKIVIKNHRQIKLIELRLLFLELKKFNLEPSFLIRRNYNGTVTFTLTIINNPKFIELLE